VCNRKLPIKPVLWSYEAIGGHGVSAGEDPFYESHSKAYAIVVYAVHPFKIIKYEDAYRIYILALHVHREGFEPCTSTFSSRSFFFTHSFFFLMHTWFFFLLKHTLLFFYPAYIALFFHLYKQG
jgi:hypothetical protein